MRSVSRSADEVAAPAVMLAAMMLVFMLPGANTPKVSWVILPIGPTGVVSVSPVTRQATSAMGKLMTTASVLCQYGMPKVACARMAMPRSAIA